MSDIQRNTEFEILLGKYLNQTLSEPEAERLLVLLKESPDLDNKIWDQVYTETLLQDIARGNANREPIHGLPLAKASIPSRWTVGKILRDWRFAAASVLTVLLCSLVGLGFHLAVHYFSSSQNNSLFVQMPAPQTPEAKTSAVACIKAMSGVVWKEGLAKAYSAGDLVSPGWLRLQSGYLVVDFYSGASVAIEGPADFRIDSSNRAFCSQGRITANVPPQAVGFQVDVPQMEVVDLGTSFTIDAGDEQSVVHVLEGQVTVQSPNTDIEFVNEGVAVAVNNTGNVNRFATDPQMRISADMIEQLHARDKRHLFEKWKKQSERLCDDPNLTVYYNFDEKSLVGRQVRNLALHGTGAASDGLMIGCRLADGRWSPKEAVEFRTISDRIRFDIPKQFESITLATWIRVDGLDREYNSIMTTDGFNEGEVHWQIPKSGVVELGINFDIKIPCLQFQTPTPVITPQHMGQWIHLAAVIDKPGREVRHYLNGELLYSLRFRMDVPICFKNIQLGNWTMPPTWDPVFIPIRHFSGAMDEFLFFDRPLSTKEIRAIYSGDYVPPAK